MGNIRSAVATLRNSQRMCATDAQKCLSQVAGSLRKEFGDKIFSKISSLTSSLAEATSRYQVLIITAVLDTVAVPIPTPKPLPNLESYSDPISYSSEKC